MTFRLLPEDAHVADFLEDSLFTDVTDDGEIYTLYRVVRITHVVSHHPDGWTHQANVARVHEPHIGVAFLTIANRVILDAQVISSRPLQ